MGTEERPSPRTKRVVLVDDHEDHREALALLVEVRCFVSASFGTAQELLR